MGHIGVKGLRSAVDGIQFDDSSFSSCRICATANIKRSPFPHNTLHRAPNILFRIHCDVCGPLPPSYGSYRYFILSTCCHSRYIFLYLMKSRDEVPDHFIHFHNLAENFSGQRIKTLRVDNAPELVRGKLQTYCSSRGITYEKTVPDSPSQNGVAERCNLTLASMARAMLLDAQLSSWFWPFAIETAVHLKNRVPHSLLPPNKTPFEFWYNYKPNLSHLRLFGSPCTTRVLSSSLSKFDSRGESGRFLGYAKNAKGYILWIPGPEGRGGSIKVRRDVAFHDFPSNPLLQDEDRSPLWDDIPLPNNVYESHALRLLFVFTELLLSNDAPLRRGNRDPTAQSSLNTDPTCASKTCDTYLFFT